MRLAGVVCLLLVVGCSFDHGQFNGPRIDGDVITVDSPLIDGPPGCQSFTTHLDTCTQLMPGDPLVLMGANTYDTDDQTLSTGAIDVVLPSTVIVTPTGNYVVVFVSSFTLAAGATLRVTGSDMDRPLGIVATDAVTIQGAIDLSDNGAGARDDNACGPLVGTGGVDDVGGASGGGGGAFAGAGGKGGNGDNDTGISLGANGGTAIAMRPTHILGGCDGGAGGDGNNDSNGGGGDGGGAIFIASATSLTINTGGSINAGGGGGAGGKSNGGAGGGGGSGGMIVLESPMVTIAGKLAANGGGGGEGADGNDGAPGNPGALSAMRAKGGAGGAGEGADGGDGGAGANPAGTAPGQVKKGGGGGGGGGVGFIAIGGSTPVTATGSVISPAFQAWP
jgi:hypothetical protein